MYLRPYREGDFEALYALDVACFAPSFRFSRKLMLETVSSGNAIVRLACASRADGSEDVLGFGAVKLDNSEGVPFGYVTTLDVRPDSRGKGLGGSLMLALEEAAARSGAHWMILHVYVKNRSALHLYERLGYARAGRERNFYGIALDAWLYRKPLTHLV